MPPPVRLIAVLSTAAFFAVAVHAHLDWFGDFLPLAGRAALALVLVAGTPPLVRLLNRAMATVPLAPWLLVVAALALSLWMPLPMVGDSHALAETLEIRAPTHWHAPLTVPVLGMLYDGLSGRVEAPAPAAFRVLSATCGALWIAAVAVHGRLRDADASTRRLAAGLLLTGGFTSQFLGSVEVYAPATLCLLLYLLAGEASLRGRVPLFVPALLLGLASSFHPSMMSAAAGLLVLAWSRRDGRLLALFEVLVGFALPIVLTLYWMETVLYRPALALFDKEHPGGADHQMFVPLFATPDDPNGLFSLSHWRLTALFFFQAAPLALTMLVVGFSGLLRGPYRRFLAAVTLGMTAFVCSWKPDLLIDDWGLFAAWGVPASLWAADAWLDGTGRPRDREWSATAIPLVSGGLLVIALVGWVWSKA